MTYGDPRGQGGSYQRGTPVRAPAPDTPRFRTEREQLERFSRLEPESQGQNLALTVVCVPCSLDSGAPGTLQGHLVHKKRPPL